MPRSHHPIRPTTTRVSLWPGIALVGLVLLVMGGCEASPPPGELTPQRENPVPTLQQITITVGESEAQTAPEVDYGWNIYSTRVTHNNSHAFFILYHKRSIYQHYDYYYALATEERHLDPQRPPVSGHALHWFPYEEKEQRELYALPEASEEWLHLYLIAARTPLESLAGYKIKPPIFYNTRSSGATWIAEQSIIQQRLALKEYAPGSSDLYRIYRVVRP